MYNKTKQEHKVSTCSVCNGKILGGVCIDCGTNMSALAQVNAPTNRCAGCGHGRGRYILFDKCIYVTRFKEKSNGAGVNICFDCYERERDKSFFIAKNQTFTHPERLKQKIMQEWQKAKFYGDDEEDVERRYVIACDYERGINPKLWVEIGLVINEADNEKA